MKTRHVAWRLGLGVACCLAIYTEVASCWDPSNAELGTLTQDSAEFYAQHGCSEESLTKIQLYLPGHDSFEFTGPCSLAVTDWRRQAIADLCHTKCLAMEGVHLVKSLSQIVSNRVANHFPRRRTYPSPTELVGRKVALDLFINNRSGAGFSLQLSQLVIGLVQAYVLEVPVLLPSLWDMTTIHHPWQRNDISQYLNVDALKDTMAEFDVPVLHPPPEWVYEATQVDLEPSFTMHIAHTSSPSTHTTMETPDRQLLPTMVVEEATLFPTVAINFPTEAFLKEEARRAATWRPLYPPLHAEFDEALRSSDSLLSGNLRDEISKVDRPTVLNMQNKVGWVGKWYLKTEVETVVARHILENLRLSERLQRLYMEIRSRIEADAGPDWIALHLRSEQDAMLNPNNQADGESDMNLRYRQEMEEAGFTPESVGGRAIYCVSGHDDYTNVRETFAGYRIVTKHDFGQGINNRLAALSMWERGAIDYFIAVDAPVFIGRYRIGFSSFPRIVTFHRETVGRFTEHLIPPGDQTTRSSYLMWSRYMKATN